MKTQDLPYREPVKFLHLVQATLLFILLSGFTFWVTSQEEKLDQETQRNQVFEKTLTFKSRLEAEINANIFLVNGLAATIISYPDLPPEKINLALKALYNLGGHVRNIGLAPGNTISHIYPMQGNEAAIGLYYPGVPSQWPAVKAAMQSRQTILSGPVTLTQGGKGIISRTPIFLDNDDYWGILSLVLDYDSLVSEFLIRADKSDLQIAIRNTQFETENPVFFGNENIFDLKPVTQLIQLPGNYWELAALPKTGWNSSNVKYTSWRTGGLLFALFTVVVFLSFQSNQLSMVTSVTRLKAILDTTHDGIVVLDSKGMICEFNPAAQELFGYTAEEVLNRSMNLLIKTEFHTRHNLYISNLNDPHMKKMSAGSDVIGVRKDGSEISVEVTIGKAKIANQSWYVGVIRDITERKANEAKLQILARTDSLTGALNRRAFQEMSDLNFALAKRYNRPLSLLSLDVDYFKLVNDTYGHDAGDQVLKELVNTLNSQLRSVDIISRFGGEEFLILLPETDVDQAVLTAEKLRQVLASREVIVHNHKITFTVSIGVATLTPIINGVPQLITAADTALYEAKGAGRNCTIVHGRAFHVQTSAGRTSNATPRIQLVR